MSRWTCIAALGLTAAACGGERLPDPKLLALEPAQMMASESMNVRVMVEMVLLFRADYGAGAVEVDPQVGVLFGGRTLPSPRYDGTGVLSVFVPSVFPPSSYDVTLQLGDGRFAVLTSGFRVQPGLWPTAYVFDPIPEQRSGVPFVVTVKAGGSNYALFHGTVKLGAINASISPEPTGSFQNGVYTGVVTATLSGATAQTVTLTATDLEGHAGSSSPFQLRP
jgi:hypothetical protein